MPNPVATYAKGKPVVAYFEVYGLQRGKSGTSRYEVSYTLLRQHGKRHEGFFPAPGVVEDAAVTESFTAESTASDAVETIHLDASALAPDDYDLVVKIHDLTSGQEATTRGLVVVRK
jgi:hypothetical protein